MYEFFHIEQHPVTINNYSKRLIKKIGNKPPL